MYLLTTRPSNLSNAWQRLLFSAYCGYHSYGEEYLVRFRNTYANYTNLTNLLQVLHSMMGLEENSTKSVL